MINGAKWPWTRSINICHQTINLIATRKRFLCATYITASPTSTTAKAIISSPIYLKDLTMSRVQAEPHLLPGYAAHYRLRDHLPAWRRRACPAIAHQRGRGFLDAYRDRETLRTRPRL